MVETPVDPPSDNSTNAADRPLPKWRDPSTAAAVGTITQVLIAAAAGWFLLQQLAPVVRPLLIAVFLAYILMPQHARLRKHIGTPASIGVLASATALVLVSLALITYANVLALNEDLPRLQRQAEKLTATIEQTIGDVTPWTATSADGSPTPSKLGEQLAKLSGPLLSVAADTLLEAIIVAMYLLFLLLEGSRFPDRVRNAYTPERAEAILHIAGQVSRAIVGYLRVKVKASLVLALPVGIILWACGVKFALLWTVLTFLCNFIPYLGPVVAYSLPIGFSFLWFGLAWQPITAAVLVLVCHALSAAVVEPTMIGNAVGLSPLVLLASLAFWGLLWGIPGMFLAVPLTVVGVIVMNHFESTRPVAQMLRGG